VQSNNIGQDDPKAGQVPGRTETIRRVNDLLRRKGKGGRVVMTAGIAALPASDITRVRAAVAAFDGFDEGNDPYGEHDFGAVTIGSEEIFWKIDYYDLDLTMHSPDPADPAVTARVLTIMLAGEY
jgi:hypothetical protein